MKKSVTNRFFFILCTLVLLASAAFSAIDECHWAIMGPASVTFDWRSTDANENIIYYGTAADKMSGSMTASKPDPVPDPNGFYWRCALKGLSPDTLYHYKITSSGAQHTFRTPPPAGSSGFTIVVTSDFQESNKLTHTSACMDLIAAAKPRFVLNCGDTTGADDYGGAPRAHKVYNLIMNKWSQDVAYMPIWGNHDWPKNETEFATHNIAWFRGRVSMPNGQSAGNPPQLSGQDWGWFDYGNTRFISYPEPWQDDSGWKVWEEKVDAVYKAAQDDANIKWIVAWGHRPGYSTGYHSNDGTKDLGPVFDAYAGKYSKFRLCFYGHNHLMEVSAPAGSHGLTYVCADSPYPCQKYEVPRASFTKFRALLPGFVKATFNSDNIVLQYVAGDEDKNHFDVSEITGEHKPGDVVYTYTIGQAAPEPKPAAQ